MGRHKFEFLLLFSVFTIATCGLVYELVAGTLASYLLGDSVKQFSFIIGIYLFSMGVGSYFAKYLTNNLLHKFIEIEILVGLVGGLSSSLLFCLFDFVEHFQFVLYLLVFTTGCLVGLEIPLLMNLLKDRVEFKDLVSNVFAFDYVGALLASLLFPLLLVPYLGIIRTSLFFGLINVFIALILCFALSAELKAASALGLKIKSVCAFLVLLLAFVFADEILDFSEEKLYDENIIFTKSTPYQRIVLTHNKKDLKLYLNNNLQFNSSDEYRYHESLVHPALSLATNIDNVLILGGGDGLAAREILKYPDVQHITLVDLDKDMTSMFQQNPILTHLNNNSLNHAKVKVINADAYIWLKTNQQKFDVAIVDFPDPSNYSVGKLYTKNFYETLKQSLTANAIVVIQSTSPYFAPKSFWCINNTLKTVFATTMPYHVYLPSFGEWGYVMATRQPQLPEQPLRKLVSLRFYDFDFNKLTNFARDMQSTETAVNQLNNQTLVRYFNEEWGNQ